MASNNKRKTTMAKLQRERGLLEKRAAKQAKKNARKRAAAEGGFVADPGSFEDEVAEDAATEDDVAEQDLAEDRLDQVE